jgi:mannose-6-phosphate isomerase-like protein (cupin superfamily)
MTKSRQTGVRDRVTVPASADKFRRMHPTTISLASKLALFGERWSPRVIGEVNDVQVKVVKLEGAFVWHRHETEDELFLVVTGRLRMQFRDGEASVGPGELIIVPRGVEHLPSAEEETHVLLVEPRSTLNTGDAVSDRTVATLERI